MKNIRTVLVLISIQVLVLMCYVYSMNNAQYVINIKNADQYYLWLRVKTTSQSSTINIKVNENSSSINIEKSSNFSWIKHSVSYAFSRGSYRISFNSNNPGTSVDKFVLTPNSSYTPIGTGETALSPSSVSHIWKVINLDGKGGTPIMGDVTGDGKTDFVVTGSTYVSLFDNSGSLIWQKNFSSGQLSYVGDGAYYLRPIDIDNDGNVEVVGIINNNNKPYLAALNGANGNIKCMYELPVLSENWIYDATQIANLRGIESPGDFIIKVAVNGYVPFKLTAYKFEDGSCSSLWSFESIPGEDRAGCQRPKVFDIDGDGKDEVLFGHWTLEEDGAIRWEKPYGFFDQHNHVDSQRAGDILPSVAGIEIAYASGSILLDSIGNVIWRKDIDEGQSVAFAEMRPDLPGLEVLFAYQEPVNDERLFSADGTLLWTHNGPSAFAASYETYPIQWIGDEGRESVRQEWGRDRSPAIYDEFNNLVVRLTPEYEYGEGGYRPCDVTGDYREELVYFNENYIVIYQNIALNPNSNPSPWSDPIYVESQYNWVYY